MPARIAARFGRIGASLALAASLGGCMADKSITGSIMPTAASREVSTPESREARWREMSASYRAAYEKNPNDAAAAYAYGTSLRIVGQRAQAVAVLETASLKNPTQKQILAAYGRALSDVGRYQDALNVLERAHTPEQPDWKILNAQGAALDQLGRSAEARGHYDAALKIAPGEPSILSNLGLSYALTNDLAKAEATLSQAAMSPKADDRVRANLGTIQGLRARVGLAPKPAQRKTGA